MSKVIGNTETSSKLTLAAINWKSAPITVIQRDGNSSAQYEVFCRIKMSNNAPVIYASAPMPMTVVPETLDINACPI